MCSAARALEQIKETHNHDLVHLSCTDVAVGAVMRQVTDSDNHPQTDQQIDYEEKCQRMEDRQRWITVPCCHLQRFKGEANHEAPENSHNKLKPKRQ